MNVDTAAKSPPRPPTLAAQLGAMRETAAASLDAAKSQAAAARAETTRKAEEPDAAEQAETARRQAAKDHAKAKVMALLEKLKAIKQFASDNPKMMAKMLAQLAKELKSAIEAYAEAGGMGSSGWQTSLAAPDSRAADDKGDVYRQMRDRVSGSEAAGDMDLVKIARGIGRTIREYLEKAKLQTGVEGPDDDMTKDVEETASTMKEVDKTLEKLDRAIKSSSPEAGLFVALYA